MCTLNSLSPTSGVREHAASTQKFRTTGCIGMAAPEQGLHRILTSKFLNSSQTKMIFFGRVPAQLHKQFNVNVFFSHRPSFGLPFLSKTSCRSSVDLCLEVPKLFKTVAKKIPFSQSFPGVVKSTSVFPNFPFYLRLYKPCDFVAAPTGRTRASAVLEKC